MRLDDALATYLYLKDQYQPSEHERQVRHQAWEVIARHAKNTINQDRWLRGRSIVSEER